MPYRKTQSGPDRVWVCFRFVRERFEWFCFGFRLGRLRMSVLLHSFNITVAGSGCGFGSSKNSSGPDGSGSALFLCYIRKLLCGDARKRENGQRRTQVLLVLQYWVLLGNWSNTVSGVRFQTPSSVSFLVLTEFRGASSVSSFIYHWCAKTNSPSLPQNSPSLPQTQ